MAQKSSPFDRPSKRRRLLTALQHPPKGRRHDARSYVRKARHETNLEEAANSIEQAMLNTAGDRDVALDWLVRVREIQAENTLREEGHLTRIAELESQLQDEREVRSDNV